MRASRSLEELIELGLIEEIIRPLQSGKEAQIYLVRCEGEQRVAKIYKEANNRSFRNRVEYTEGRRVRNSRQQRAMEKKSRYGKEELEAAWKVAELEVLYKLHAANVRVPQPYQFIDGILIMELITNADGGPAPRLIDLTFTPKEAKEMLELLVQDVVKMLCAGIVHGDLSDFNILVEPTGPVIIDFPQACDPAKEIRYWGGPFNQLMLDIYPLFATLLTRHWVRSLALVKTSAPQSDAAHQIP